MIRGQKWTTGDGTSGERWGCLSLDRTSRFISALATGPRTAPLAEQVVHTTRERTAGRAGIRWLRDGWDAYQETSATIYRDAVPTGIRDWIALRLVDGVQLPQAVKERRGRRLVRVEVRAVIGAAAAQSYAVPVERLNGALRDRLGPA